MGLAQVKDGTSYVWLSESTSLLYKSKAFTCINIFDALPMVLVGLYYIFVSQDWFWICFIFLMLTYIAIFLLIFCPESPRWHLINGRTPEAIMSLNQIAQMNGKEDRIPDDAIFVEDPTNFLDTRLFSQQSLYSFKDLAIDKDNRDRGHMHSVQICRIDSNLT